MVQKILYCASTMVHIKNFHIPYIKVFHEKGYEVWVAANKKEEVPYADKVVALPFQKSFFSFQNIKAVFEARKLIKNENFEIISVHTMLASAVIRAAVLLLRKRPKVFNTVHGYLFHESDGIKKWKYIIPEKICAHVTDVLMVMNHEDYDIAKKHKLYKDKLYYIDGMGIDLAGFAHASKEMCNALRKRSGFGFDDKDFLFMYAAEFSKRKNQSLLIRAFADVTKKMPEAHLLLAGDGALTDECKVLARKLNVDGKVHFLGYIKNMKNLYYMCNACVTVSHIEGLPFNVMEAMACGLPVIASRIKGHIELIENEKTGLLFEDDNKEELESAMIKLYNSEILQKKFGTEGLKKVRQFDINNVIKSIIHIYGENI